MHIPQLGFGTYICEGAGCTSEKRAISRRRQKKRSTGRQSTEAPSHTPSKQTHFQSYTSENIFLKATYDVYCSVHLQGYLNDTS